MSCGVGHRCGLHLVWLWLAAVTLIRPLAWELPDGTGAALKKKKKKREKKKGNNFTHILCLFSQQLDGHLRPDVRPSRYCTWIWQTMEQVNLPFTELVLFE